MGVWRNRGVGSYFVDIGKFSFEYDQGLSFHGIPICVLYYAAMH